MRNESRETIKSLFFPEVNQPVNQEYLLPDEFRETDGDTLDKRDYGKQSSFRSKALPSRSDSRTSHTPHTPMRLIDSKRFQRRDRKNVRPKIAGQFNADDERWYG